MSPINKNNKVKKSDYQLNRTTLKVQKPVLIACGKHLINPSDIRIITKVRKDLYVVKFFSDPNPTYPCWVEAKEINKLLNHFEIIVSDDGEE